MCFLADYVDNVVNIGACLRRVGNLGERCALHLHPFAVEGSDFGASVNNRCAEFEDSAVLKHL